MLFEVTKTDTRCYENELKNRLPRRMIDIHTHSKVIESGQTGRKNDARLVTWPSMVAKINPIEDLLETYRLMFPEQTVTPLLLPGIQPLERIDDLNAYTLDAAAREKVPTLLYTHPSLDPSELEETLKREKRQGIKVYLNNSPKYIPPNEIRIYDYLPPAHLEVLDSLGLIVMLHIPRAARLRDPVNLAQVLEIEKRYRNLHLILAHVGRAYCNEDAGDAFAVLKETERLVFDVSANTNAWIFARAIEALGPRRILFGSDLPVARMRMKRVCEDGFYINVVPKGLYGDVSADKHMREVEGKDAENLTFFLYEEIKAILNAADETGLTDQDLENLFYNNAKDILESTGFVLYETADLLIGFDLGTSATKAILTDTAGNIIAKASRAVEYSRPAPDYCEFDSKQYVKNVIEILHDLATQTEHPEMIKAVSFCGASGNALLLDSKYKPITKTIAWNDRRTAGKAAELWPGLDVDRVYKQAGWPFNGVMPLAQLAWFKKNEPEAWSKAGYFTMNNDYLYHRLCGRLVVDPSKATTFYLQDRLAETWNEELLDFLDIESASLSEIVPSGTVVGTLLPELCVQTGLSKETRIVAGSFDHPSAARSTGVFQEGDILVSAGTSWVVFAPVKQRQVGIDNTMLVDPFLSPEGCWGVMFALTSVAEKIDTLLKNRFGDVKELYKIFDTTAAQSGPGADSLYIDPWKQDPDEVAKAAAAVSDASFSRALMEGCAYQLKSKIDQLHTALADGISRIVMVGGPTKSPVWPGILAGVIGAPLYIPESGQHAGALGAAIMAGIGAGVYNDVKDGWNHVKTGERTEIPETGDIGVYKGLYETFSKKFNI